MQLERFLRRFAADLGLTVKHGEWLAGDFRNESVSYDVELACPVTKGVQLRGSSMLTAITSPDAVRLCGQQDVSPITLFEFARIGAVLDPDEKFLIALYEDDGLPESAWHEVTYRQAAEIRSYFDQPLVSYGMVQGVFHAWYAGSKPPCFVVRELSSGALIRCVYKPEQYRRVHMITAEENSVANVYGDIHWDRSTELIVQVSVSDIDLTRSLTAREFDSVFGSIPSLTGELSTSDYVAWLRGDDEFSQ